jgi:hypothetical protein
MFEFIKSLHEAIHTDSTLAFILFVAAIFAIIGGSLAWVVDLGYQRSLKEKPPSGNNIQKLVTPDAPKISTLYDLFKSDCKKTHMLGTYTLNGTNDAGKMLSYEIKYNICGDFETKTLYISFFLPKAEHTFLACKYMPTAYKDILGGNIRKLMQGIVHRAPGEKAETRDELKPSGRLYVYHETRMLPDQIDELTKEYKKEGLSPQFRGRDYEIMRNSPLYDDKHY